MKRAVIGLVLLLAATMASADNRTRTLTRGLADALYCQLAGTCTVQTLTITGTCTGCGGAGTVTSVSVVSANGFAGTVATATTTPAITLTATANGILKSNGTAISAATSGTDYSAGTSSLATGILKSTTTTGGLTIAVAGDFPTLNQSTSGTAALATAADHTPTACGANTFAQSQSTAWAFTCVGLTLAGAQFANQGTTTTVAHGNASGNPSWAKVVDGDTTFTAPALGAPTATTIQTSGNVGLGIAPSVTAGQWILAGSAANQADVITAQNTDAVDTTAQAQVLASADTANVRLIAHGTGRTTTRYGVTVAGYGELIQIGGNGLLLGTFSAAPLIVGTNSVAVEKIDGSNVLTWPLAAPTAGTMTATTVATPRAVWSRYDWTNAMVTALSSTAGDVAICTLPAKTIVRNAYVVIKTAAATVSTLTVAVGRTSATYIDYIVASDAKAAANTVYGDASAERGTNLTSYDLPSYTGTTVVNAHFISTGGNLSTTTTSTGTVYLETELLP